MDISQTSIHRTYGDVHRAAHHFYYRDIKGLSRPPENGPFRIKMKIGVIDEFGEEAAGKYRPHEAILFRSQIKLWTRDSNNNRRGSMGTYALTIHELAHAAHWKLLHPFSAVIRSARMVGSARSVCESWANGVEWELTRMVYSDYKGEGDPDTNYTMVVVDLIDRAVYSGSERQDNDAPANTGYSDDRDMVEGYTIKQIESTLQPRSGHHIGLWWHDWHDYFYTSYLNSSQNPFNNPTAVHVERLFHNWD